MSDVSRLRQGFLLRQAFGETKGAEDGGQRSAVRGKKAHARPFKDRFLKYNENIFFDGLRWYDFHRGCAS
jgi:hypothetical protein